jgi:hypothetical protein
LLIGGTALGLGSSAFSRRRASTCSVRTGFSTRPAAKIAEVGPQFVRAEFAVLVFVQRFQGDSRVFDFFVRQLAIAVGIEGLHDRELKAAAPRTAAKPPALSRRAIAFGSAAVALGTLGVKSGAGGSRQNGRRESDDRATHERDPPEVSLDTTVRCRARNVRDGQKKFRLKSDCLRRKVTSQ